MKLLSLLVASLLAGCSVYPTYYKATSGESDMHFDVWWCWQGGDRSPEREQACMKSKGYSYSLR